MPTEKQSALLARAGLDEIPALAWLLLAEGAASGRAAFHTPVLATQGAQGPDARTVVLRAAKADIQTLICHTDIRSPKWRALEHDEALAWIFYDPAAKLQLRFSGRASLHHKDELAQARWLTSRASSRECYRNPFAPGTMVDDPQTALRAPLEDGFSNFGVIACRVQTMDWLYLRAGGHRRAIFDYRGGDWQGNWVAP